MAVTRRQRPGGLRRVGRQTCELPAAARSWRRARLRGRPAGRLQLYNLQLLCSACSRLAYGGPAAARPPSKVGSTRVQTGPPWMCDRPAVDPLSPPAARALPHAPPRPQDSRFPTPSAFEPRAQDRQRPCCPNHLRAPILPLPQPGACERVAAASRARSAPCGPHRALSRLSGAAAAPRPRPRMRRAPMRKQQRPRRRPSARASAP